MPFGTITVGSDNYEPRSPGVYSKSTVAYNDPRNEFRIKGSVSAKGNRVASVQRIIEKDVTVNGVTTRYGSTVSLQITTSPVGGLTSTEADSAVADISTFLTSGTVSRLLQGES